LSGDKLREAAQFVHVGPKTRFKIRFHPASYALSASVLPVGYNIEYDFFVLGSFILFTHLLSRRNLSHMIDCFGALSDKLFLNAFLGNRASNRDQELARNVVVDLETIGSFEEIPERRSSDCCWPQGRSADMRRAPPRLLYRKQRDFRRSQSYSGPL